MAGNRRAYEAAMKRAASFAWDKKWSRAIEEYNKALAEFPQDVTTLTGLGLAYAETRQLEKALDTYKQAANLAQDNPEVIQRVGNMFERLAQWPEAANAYVLAANACVHLHDMPQAVELWGKAAMLDPGNLTAHQGLAQAYRDQGLVRKAARQHLIIARVQERQKQTRNAITHCQAALELDPRNAEARAILDALNRGQPLPDGPTARLQPDAEGKRTLDSFVVFEDIELKSAALLSDELRASPADMVRERTLAQMAEALFSESSDPKTMQANLLLAQGADFQTRGLTDKAIDAYSSAIRIGADTPAVHFNLGLLHHEKREFEQAIEHLSQASSHPDYILGAHFAMGECYRDWGKTSEALQYLLETLRIIDSQTMPEDQVDELNVGYEHLAQRYVSQDNSEAARRFVRAIVSFLSDQGWGRRVIQTRKQLSSTAGGVLLITLAETLAEPAVKAATASMAKVQEYLQRNMLFTALEECFWAIQQAPYYLPLHLHMADVLIKEGRLEEAVQKYITVARTYQVRGDLSRAVAIYRKALEISPMNVEGREQLIRMLLDAGMIDQAIEQYIVVADSYYQLAQVNQALEKYDNALMYAAQGDPSRHWEVNVLHRIGDIHMQRLGWQQATRTYRRVKRVDPDDTKARTYLVDLYFKTGQQDQALKELDELIGFYKAKRQPRELLSTLQDIVRSRPDELALHMRLARLYLEMKMKEEAITELNTIGEIQLQAGMTQEAIRTIQAIIRLGPEHAQGYQQLLAQLKSQ